MVFIYHTWCEYSCFAAEMQISLSSRCSPSPAGGYVTSGRCVLSCSLSKMPAHLYSETHLDVGQGLVELHWLQLPRLSPESLGVQTRWM